VASYRPLTPWTIDRVNHRNHRRILVLDGRVGVIGSGTSSKWSGNGKQEGLWRDTDMRVEGPVVGQLQGAFTENWLEATGVALGSPDYFPWPIEAKATVESQIVGSSPAGSSLAMYIMFLLAMASAPAQGRHSGLRVRGGAAPFQDHGDRLHLGHRRQRRSFELNEELNLVVYNEDIARRLERVFVDDLEVRHPASRAADCAEDGA
jgi:phosphatidylserine/phosphatidylglycerophosphate/cardiolipin synthase-like enzyme